MLEFMIKPSSVLKKAVATISLMAAEATICYSPNGLYIEAVADQGVFADRIVAILRINLATACLFRCNVVGGAEIDPKALYRALDTVNTNEWSVRAYSNAGVDKVSFQFANPRIDGEFFRVINKVSFQFANPRIDGFEFDEIEFVHVDAGDIGDPIKVLAVEYRSVFGISSLEFIRILTHFFYHGDIVQVEVKEKRVTFSLGDEKIVLKKKYQHCIIGGDAFTFSIDLGFLPYFMNAAAQTPIVWIHGAAEVGDPVMLNIPLGSFLGNLMLYFFGGCSM